MTAGTPAGAVAHREVDWRAMDWRAVHCEVRRLQARIVKAMQVRRCKAASRKGRLKGLSCIKRKFYVQFLGGGEAVMPPCYPATAQMRLGRPVCGGWVGKVRS
jgi:hypothetical protein